MSIKSKNFLNKSFGIVEENSDEWEQLEYEKSYGKNQSNKTQKKSEWVKDGNNSKGKEILSQNMRTEKLTDFLKLPTLKASNDTNSDSNFKEFGFVLDANGQFIKKNELVRRETEAGNLRSNLKKFLFDDLNDKQVWHKSPSYPTLAKDISELDEEQIIRESDIDFHNRQSKDFVNYKSNNIDDFLRK